MLQLYKNIKEKRTENGWSQTELAKRVGYSDKSMIAKIESGKVDLTQSKIMEFARVFGCDPGDLMGWDDHIQEEPEKWAERDFEVTKRVHLLNDTNYTLLIKTLDTMIELQG